MRRTPLVLHARDDVAQVRVVDAQVSRLGDRRDAGQIRRVVSGPPVAESSSAASTSASTATRTAPAASRPGRHSFFREPRANTEPEPTAWWSCSSYRPPVTS
ncbi:Uncharacterised protein [Cellulomonas fimi]|nr:Uncharacterised protein [Cellulomonas fimi]